MSPTTVLPRKRREHIELADKMEAKKINVISHHHVHAQKKLTVAAVIICSIITTFNLYVVLKPYFLRSLTRIDMINVLIPSDMHLLHARDHPLFSNSDKETNMKPMIWNYSNLRTDAYEVEGDIRIQGSSSTIFIASNSSSRGIYITVKPHPQKYSKSAMASVTGFTMKTGPPDTIPQCTRIMEVPTILFSTGGHVENYFHRITDVLIPLFATSERFHRRVVFLVTNWDSRLASNHKETLEKLSEYVVRDIDGDDEILCFPRMMVGLKASELSLSIDPTPSSSFSMRNFTKFLRGVYFLERESVHVQSQPRMLIITRGSSRRLTNHVEVGDMARSLGFEVVEQDFGWNITSVAELVNTVDVMVGVHGAGLTNMVFLPENAVVIQITPLGIDAYAKIYLGRVQVEEMKLKYLEYKVRLNESSLAGKYPADSEVYKNSVGYCLSKGFHVCKKVFLDNQDVTLHLPTFRKTLSQTLDLLALHPPAAIL